MGCGYGVGDGWFKQKWDESFLFSFLKRHLEQNILHDSIVQLNLNIALILDILTSTPY